MTLAQNSQEAVVPQVTLALTVLWTTVFNLDKPLRVIDPYLVKLKKADPSSTAMTECERPHSELHPVSQSIRAKLKEGFLNRFVHRYQSVDRDFSQDLVNMLNPATFDLSYLKSFLPEYVAFNERSRLVSYEGVVTSCKDAIKKTAIYLAKLKDTQKLEAERLKESGKKRSGESLFHLYFVTFCSRVTIEFLSISLFSSVDNR